MEKPAHWGFCGVRIRVPNQRLAMRQMPDCQLAPQLARAQHPRCRTFAAHAQFGEDREDLLDRCRADGFQGFFAGMQRFRLGPLASTIWWASNRKWT